MVTDSGQFVFSWHISKKQLHMILLFLVSYVRDLTLKPAGHCPERKTGGTAGAVHPVWNLRAVIWFPFPISCLVFLPSPLALSVLSFFS